MDTIDLVACTGMFSCLEAKLNTLLERDGSLSEYENKIVQSLLIILNL